MRMKFMGPAAQATVEKEVSPEPMSKPSTPEKLKLEKYMAEHQAALEVFHKKEQDYPMLTKPVEMKPPEKKRRISYTKMDTVLITKEKITDDQGKEINFIRPSGDRI